MKKFEKFNTWFDGLNGVLKSAILALLLSSWVVTILAIVNNIKINPFLILVMFVLDCTFIVFTCQIVASLNRKSEKKFLDAQERIRKRHEREMNDIRK